MFVIIINHFENTDLSNINLLEFKILKYNLVSIKIQAYFELKMGSTIIYKQQHIKTHLSIFRFYYINIQQLLDKSSNMLVLNVEKSL